MSSESRLAVVIFAFLVVAILVPFLMWRSHEANRPLLVEARVVTATSADPVLRDGQRRVAADEELKIAVAVRMQDHEGGELWIAPGEHLELDGQPVAHQNDEQWPEKDRILRVFWFTIENAYLGGDLSPDNCNKKIAYRSYLAPEMGRACIAETVPEAHNDDLLGRREAVVPVNAGTLRFYARVELVSDLNDVKAHQSLTTLGASEIANPAMATVMRSSDWAPPLHTAAGELFNLPGFEPEDEPPGTWDEVPRADQGLAFTELVRRRLLVSSRTFAATAVSGSEVLDDARLADLGTIDVGGTILSRSSRPLRWQEEVRSGDILRDGGRWIVLVSDNGNGSLDQEDLAVLCWRRPPAMLPLEEALSAAPVRLGHLRFTEAAASP